MGERRWKRKERIPMKKGVKKQMVARENRNRVEMRAKPQIMERMGKERSLKLRERVMMTERLEKEVILELRKRVKMGARREGEVKTERERARMSRIQILRTLLHSEESPAS